MILPDVNVLIHAFRQDSEDHELCRNWLEATLNADSHYGISPLVLSGVIRIVTHPKVFTEPSSLPEVQLYCNVLLGQQNCVLVHPGVGHWQIFMRLCREVRARGNLVPDAYLAALAIEWACDWITLDRDFSRFPGLSWRTP